MKLAKWFGAAAVAVAVLGLAACGASNKEAGNGKDKTVTIKIGTMTIDNDEQQRWDLIQKKLEKENVKLEFTQFTEYPQVNKAVADGELDVNAFQHYYYLNNWNKENNQDLVAIADTYIAPIRLYSGTKDGKNKYKKVNELPDGAEIAVPNDATNESRALNLLQAAGLIKLDKSGNELATVAKRFGVDASGLRYMMRLIERYGIEIVKKGKNCYYSPELKQEMIDKVLLEGWSKERVSLEYGLPARATLHN